MEIEKIFYRCDGEVESCTKESCFKNGGGCRHTLNPEHAVNFRKTASGLQLFEKIPETEDEKQPIKEIDYAGKSIAEILDLLP